MIICVNLFVIFFDNLQILFQLKKGHHSSRVSKIKIDINETLSYKNDFDVVRMSFGSVPKFDCAVNIDRVTIRLIFVTIQWTVRIALVISKKNAALILYQGF